MPALASAQRIHLELADEVAKFYADPYGFVRFAYPWGEKGRPLEKESGPDDNQKEFLQSLGAEVRKRKFTASNGYKPVMPILMSESSGHGTGKSAMGAWLTDWILSTRPHSIGTVTAGTATQLDERTWAAIEHWTRLCITAPWFDIMAKGIYSKTSPETWKVVTQTCKEENAQSFAGQHARTSTSWYLFDEASAVPGKIFQVAYEGGLTDGEPMMFAWGQMERNTGWFYEICFGNQAQYWNHRTVDSRTARFTNKELIERQIREYGEDSDIVRVRVFGLPPRASEFQFIDTGRVDAAKTRAVPGNLPGEPLICGVDVSGGGSAWNVCAFRRGLDARTIPRYRLPGEAIRHDRGLLVGKLAEILADDRPERKVAAMFVDSAFGSPIVERLHALGYRDRVHEVNFGGESPNQHQANMRAYMWNAMKDWLLKGAIPTDSEMAERDRLCAQVILPGFGLNRSNKLVLESKQDMQKRGERSPDDADALALTFARPVAIPKPQKRYWPGASQASPWS